MQLVRETHAEPIAGYRLLDRLGSGGFGEVWKCEAPGGLFKAIKFVYGNLNDLRHDGARAEKELQAVQRIKDIRHPFLLSMDRVECIDGELIIVMELADRNLQELMVQYQSAGLTGIPRHDLLSYLQEAAEVLDVIHRDHLLQHLDIKPGNLFVVSKHVKVGDFGLVNSLSGSGPGESKVLLGAITPLYASPELFHGTFSQHSDQYSLAIVYQELLTGVLPFQGKNCRQLLMMHATAHPNLEPLPPADRAAVAKALAKKPEHRFPSCTEFVQALLDRPKETTATSNTVIARALPLADAPTWETIHNPGKDTDFRLTTGPRPQRDEKDAFTAFLEASRWALPPPTPTDENMDCIIADILAGLGTTPAQGLETPVFAADGIHLRHRFQVGLTLAAARLKLAAFCRHWYGQIVDDHDFGLILHIDMPGNFWRPWSGCQPGLEIEVKLAPIDPLNASPIEVSVSIRAFRSSKKRARALLEEMAPRLLESLHSFLLVNSEKRMQDRVPWTKPVRIRPLASGNRKGQVIECTGKDISQTGIGLILPRELETSEVLVELPSKLHPPSVSIPATLVRAQRRPDGAYDVGALFRLPAARKVRTSGTTRP
jgi:serine/threonine protein kinase